MTRLTRPPITPGSPAYVSAEEILVDEWSTEHGRYQLVERAGLYSLKVWDLYRFVQAEEKGFQILAARAAELTRGREEKVLPFEVRHAG